MPKSKREKPVFLTQVQKKGKDHRVGLFDRIRRACDDPTHQYIYVFSVINSRAKATKNIRAHFEKVDKDSDIIFAKTTVMAKALGETKPEEYQPGLAQLTKFLEGGDGLLFSAREPDEVEEYFKNFSEMDYARANVEATQDFVVPAGIVYETGGQQPVEDDVPLTHNEEVRVRSFGMPTRLDKGKVVLDSDYAVCKKGQKLNANQTALLKRFGVQLSESTVLLRAHWSSATQEVTTVKPDTAMEE